MMRCRARRQPAVPARFPLSAALKSHPGVAPPDLDRALLRSKEQGVELMCCASLTILRAEGAL